MFNFSEHTTWYAELDGLTRGEKTAIAEALSPMGYSLTIGSVTDAVAWSVVNGDIFQHGKDAAPFINQRVIVDDLLALISKVSAVPDVRSPDGFTVGQKVKTPDGIGIILGWKNRRGFHYLVKVHGMDGHSGAGFDLVVGSAKDADNNCWWYNANELSPVDDVAIQQNNSNTHNHTVSDIIAVPDVRSHNIGNSDYAKHAIQPWDIWLEYRPNPWVADIIKRALRKKGDSPSEQAKNRREDFVKIRHICDELIRQIDAGQYWD